MHALKNNTLISFFKYLVHVYAIITRISTRFKYVFYLYLHNRVKGTLKDTLNAFQNFKNKQKSVGSNVF